MKMYHMSWLAGAVTALTVTVASAEHDGGATVVTVPDAGPDAPSLLEIYPSDNVLGDRDAPVTIFEFASLTCPHCAAFHVNTLPDLKAELIETGKANLVVRHFPLDQLALRGAMVAECVPPAQYHQFIDVLYQTQTDWRDSGDPMQALIQTAMLAGLPRGDIEACLQDETLLNGILSVRLRAQSELGVESTPTFYIGNQMVRGAQPYGVFAEAVAAATPAMPAAAEADEAADDESAESEDNDGDEDASDDAESSE